MQLWSDCLLAVPQKTSRKPQVKHKKTMGHPTTELRYHWCVDFNLIADFLGASIGNNQHFR